MMDQIRGFCLLISFRADLWEHFLFLLVVSDDGIFRSNVHYNGVRNL